MRQYRPNDLDDNCYLWLLVASSQLLWNVCCILKRFTEIVLRKDCKNFSVNGGIHEKMDDTPHHAHSPWCDEYHPLLCRLRSIATHRDHFVRRLSVRLSHSQSYVSQAIHAFLGMLPLFFRGIPPSTEKFLQWFHII